MDFKTLADRVCEAKSVDIKNGPIRENLPEFSSKRDLPGQCEGVLPSQKLATCAIDLETFPCHSEGSEESLALEG